jgi:membrane protein YqaA with SNARE-associated domain
MPHLPAVAALFATGSKKRSILRWLVHLGGPGLIILGILDNSALPLPGSMDVITIVLAAHRREPWFYYTIMATAGAVLGGYLTYRMARKGGKEAFERRLSKKKADNLYAQFDRWGFAAVAIPAILPPPFPIVPVLLTAGAMQYPTKKFLSALTVGRGIRYTIIAFLGATYGHGIIRFFSRYYMPTLIVLIAGSVAAGLFGLFEYRKRRNSVNPQLPEPETTARHRAA